MLSTTHPTCASVIPGNIGRDRASWRSARRRGTILCVAEVRVGVGEMAAPVMMSGADIARGEMVSEAVTIDSANNEQVPDLASVARVRKRQIADSGKALDVEIGGGPTLGVPFVEVRELPEEHGGVDGVEASGPADVGVPVLLALAVLAERSHGLGELGVVRDQRSGIDPARAPRPHGQPSQRDRRSSGDRHLLQREVVLDESDPVAVGGHKRHDRIGHARQRRRVNPIEPAHDQLALIAGAAAGSIPLSASKTSTGTGTPPACVTASKVATKVIAGTSTSAPCSKPRPISASRSASSPLASPMQ